jgi:hypothetical protein
MSGPSAVPAGGRWCQRGARDWSAAKHYWTGSPGFPDAEGWRLEQPEPGVLVWCTPSGRTYVTARTVYPA